MHAAAAHDDPVPISRFLFDERAGLLLDMHGNETHLRPQSAMVLALLVRNRGKVVSKDELIAAVWQDVTVTDDSLVQCITEIRRALEDGNRQLVKTFAKRGYRLAPDEAAAIAAPPPVNEVIDLNAIAEAAGAPRMAVMQVEMIGADRGARDFVAQRLGQANICHLAAEGARLLIGLDAAADAIRLALSLASDAAAMRLRMCIAMDLCRISPATGRPDGGMLVRLGELAAGGQPGQILATAELREMAVDLFDCLFTDEGSCELPSGPAHVFRVTPSTQASRIVPQIFATDIAPTIAVMPLAAPQAGAGELIGDLFADDLITCLSRSTEVNVISRLSTAAFRNRNIALSDMRNALNADYLLSGSIMSRGDDAILRLELVDARSGSVLWGDRLQASVAGIMHDMTAVYRAASQIRKAIVFSGIDEVRKHPYENLRTYSLLFGAIGLMHRMTRRDFMTARQLLDALIQRAPDQPTPLAWLARWHVLRLQQGWHEDAKADAQAALDCADRALEIDPEHSLALTSKGIVLTNLWRNLDQAELCYDGALDSNPNDANARLLRGMLYGYQGRGIEARKDTELALHLAPLDPHRFFFLALAAGANIAAEDYGRALELSEQSLRMNRGHTSTIRGKIIAQMGLGQEAEAHQTARELLELQPNFTVSEWLQTSPAGAFEIGTHIARTLRAAGIPD